MVDDAAKGFVLATERYDGPEPKATFEDGLRQTTNSYSRSVWALHVG